MITASVKTLSKKIYHHLPKCFANVIFALYLLVLAPWRWVLRCIVRHRKDRMRQVVVIGDSHAAFFAGNNRFRTRTIYEDRKIGMIQYEKENDPRFCVLRLGPALAYNADRYGTTVKTLEKYEWLRREFLRGDETVIVVLGEIDIRTHVFKYSAGNNDYHSVVMDILLNYMRFLNMLKDDGFRVYAWGPVASQKDSWVENIKYPRCGNEVQRNMATEYFNDTLESMCKQNDIGYMSVFNDVVTKDYLTREEYICDFCHLGQNARPFLEQQLVREKVIT